MRDHQPPLAPLPAAALAIIEAAPDAMLVTDRRGRIVFASSQAGRLFGYSQEELLGRDVEILIPERFAARHPEYRNRYFLDPRTRPVGAAGVELWGRRKDGSEFPAEISLSPLPTEDGVLAIAAVRDASARRRVEAKFRGLVEAAPDAIVITDQRGRIVLVNAQAERLFGYAREELLGELVEALIPKRFRSSHPRHRTVYFQEPKTRSMGADGIELWGLRQDGSEFPAEISLSPLETEEGTLAVTVIRDVTERRKAEEARIRLAQAQEAVRLRDEFLSIAAHELRTPLTALQLHLQSVEHELRNAEPESPSARLHTRVERAVRQTVRLTDLVNTLLDLSRMIGGRLAIDCEETDLARIARDVVDHFRAEAARQGCELSIACDPPEIRGIWDRFRLEQVLTNLLSNAIKYGARRPVHVRASREGDTAILQVRDEGIGIASADAARIFQKFERAVSSSQYPGMGLGLYITRGLVEAHGGLIRVQSEPGRGATFTVELPCTPPAATDPDPTPGAGAPAPAPPEGGAAT